MRLTEAIQELCAEKGISVNKLAKRAGLTQSTVDSILKGKSVNPRMDTIEKLADGFGMDRTEFWVRAKSQDSELTPHQEHFVAKLKQLRESTGLSMHDFAEKLAIDTDHYLYWEAGFSHPTIDGLIAIADYFNVSIDYLVGRSDDPTRR
ncbi:hypothetical protein FACS1894187_05500 [Synergistales bacterium]|nr:hypothetical protein FACS1894187_05500 [Synergistales bacterium]